MPPNTPENRALRRGTWTPEEDQKLIAYIVRYGVWNWTEIPKYAGVRRSGKSCRLRWMNYLRPGIRRGSFTMEENEIILQLHQSLGNRWAAIAARLPGRTENEIKNHWHVRLRRSLNNNSGSSAEPHGRETSNLERTGSNNVSQQSSPDNSSTSSSN